MAVHHRTPNLEVQSPEALESKTRPARRADHVSGTRLAPVVQGRHSQWRSHLRPVEDNERHERLLRRHGLSGHLSRLPHGALQDLHRLGAAHCQRAIEDEKRHTAHPH